jgi:hypothetical protein
LDYWIVYDAEARKHKVVGKRDEGTGLKTFFEHKDRRQSEAYLSHLYLLPPDQRPK